MSKLLNFFKNNKILVLGIVLALMASFFWNDIKEIGKEEAKEKAQQKYEEVLKEQEDKQEEVKQTEKDKQLEIDKEKEKQEALKKEEEKKLEIAKAEALKKQEIEKEKLKKEEEEAKKYKEEIIKKDQENIEKKDKYLTDPVPAGKPKPVEWQDISIDKTKTLTCTLSIRCDTILNNMEKLDPAKMEVLPSDGTIYAKKEVVFHPGESVFDVLLREVQTNKIHMEYEMTPIYNSNYIEGIHNLYEFDCGELSGWMYKVNGWFPNYGCSRYVLKDKDVIEWVYTCDLGRDVGGGMAVGGSKK